MNLFEILETCKNNKQYMIARINIVCKTNFFGEEDFSRFDGAE